MAEPKAITAEGNGSITSRAQRDLQIGPSIGCDQQIEGGFVAHNELTLSGWATSPHGISGVVVQIDDRLLNAAYGLDTSWLADRESDTAAGRAGFELNVDTAEWTRGRRDVKIVAFDHAGGRAELSGQVEILPYEALRFSPEEIKAAIAAGETVMWLERPPIVEGLCEIEGRVEISGWAYAQDGLDSVRVTIDGRTINALRPIVRPDLVEEHGTEMAGVAGFSLSLDPSECLPGPHRLTVVAVGPGSRGVGVSGNLVCRTAPGVGKPEPGKVAEVEWIEDRITPRERGEVDRYQPREHAGSLFEVDHQLRYRWAAPLAEGCTVLDAGCGCGWGTALLAGAGAERVFGVESSEEALAEARERTADLTVELGQADLGALPFDDASFDLIVCFGAIERAVDRELALEELRRVLRPEGLLLISSSTLKAASLEGSNVDGYTAGEFEKALRDRFANVRLHRQQDHLASTVLDDEARAVGDGEAIPGIDVGKLAVERPGGEAHTLAIAGEGALPELSRVALLASPRGIQRVHDSARTWEDRALHAEAEAAATRVQVNLARMHQEATTKALRERDREQAELEAARERLAEQETRLVQQYERLSEQDARIEEQNERLSEQYERLSEQDARIWAQHEQIEQQHEQLAQRDALLDSQAATLGARNAELRVTAERMRRAEAETAAWRDSSSARVTRPLRAVTRGARRIRNAVFQRRRG